MNKLTAVRIATTIAVTKEPRTALVNVPNINPPKEVNVARNGIEISPITKVTTPAISPITKDKLKMSP